MLTLSCGTVAGGRCCVTGADVLVLAASGGAALLALTAILRRAEGDPLALLWPDPGAEAGEAPLLRHGDHLLRPTPAEIGRASCRERVSFTV